MLLNHYHYNADEFGVRAKAAGKKVVDDGIFFCSAVTLFTDGRRSNATDMNQHVVNVFHPRRLAHGYRPKIGRL